MPHSSQPPPLRQAFVQRLTTLAVRPAARGHYIRWAESWLKARANRSPAATAAYFQSLGRSAHMSANST